MLVDIKIYLKFSRYYRSMKQNIDLISFWEVSGSNILFHFSKSADLFSIWALSNGALFHICMGDHACIISELVITIYCLFGFSSSL